MSRSADSFQKRGLPMQDRSFLRRPGFTLVELMTVIAIIVLLVGILIPALSSVRKQAKETATAAIIKSIGDGCEMFHGDFGAYPQSRGYNPFEGEAAQIPLAGAQWLTLQLSGPDSQGYVNPTVKNDANGDDKIDQNDWLEWYGLPANQSRSYTRNGPYADPDGKQVRSVNRVIEENQDVTGIPSLLVSNGAGGNGGGSIWSNQFIPFYVDQFEYPILYYAATPGVKPPFTTGTPGSNFTIGKYDQSDNAAFTGSDGNDGRYPVTGPGWDLTGAQADPANYRHPLGTLGYVKDQDTWPDPKTFAAFVCDQNVFDNTAQSNGRGLLQPHNPNTFLLISAGADGVYGTGDDIANFEHN